MLWHIPPSPPPPPKAKELGVPHSFVPFQYSYACFVVITEDDTLLAVFTPEDGQWSEMDKSTSVKTGRIQAWTSLNFSFHLAVWWEIFWGWLCRLDGQVVLNRPEFALDEQMVVFWPQRGVGLTKGVLFCG